MVEISVQMPNERWIEALPECEHLVRETVLKALDGLRMTDPTLELSLVLADNEMIQTLNRDYRGKDTATNVLAFPAVTGSAPGAPRLLGDIVVAFEALDNEATAQSKSLRDHLQHLVLHGLLHLLEFDHDTDENAAEMERLETEILKQMGVDDPYQARVANAMEGPHG